MLRRAGLLVVLGGLVLGLAACEHVTEPIDGPRLVDRFGDFALLDPLEASRAAVDFASGEDVVFSARFNKQVNWTIEITGQESGAVKRLEGFSNELDADEARWQGGTTELPLFKTEPAEVALFFPGEEAADTLRTTVEVVTPRPYPGAVVTGFEGAGARITVGNFEFEFAGSAGLSEEVPAGEGDQFYLLRGTDNVVENFFVGLIALTPRQGDYFEVPTSVPEELYLNAFLYSFDTPHTIAILQVITDTNGSGAFEDGQDQVFEVVNRTVDWSGWRLASAPMSQVGMTQAQAQEIVAVRVVLISDNNTQPATRQEVDFGVDYITFTAGGPLELSP